MNSFRPPPPTGWSANPTTTLPSTTNNTTRLPGAPPTYAFIARVYKRPLGPVVLTVAVIASIWSFIWGISALTHLSGAGNFKTIDIALGAMYLTVGTIELFGIFVGWKPNIMTARLYAFLSIFDALLVVAAESVRFSTYFTHKKELIDTCTTDSTGETFTTFGGFWGTRGTTETLSATEAAQFCNDSWSRSVWSSVAWLLIATVVAWFMVSLAFSYYYQLLSPQQIPPSQAYALGTYPGQQQPYNPSGGYQYPAPPGPPPQQSREEFAPPYDPAKLPEYGAGANMGPYPSGKEQDMKMDPDDSTEDVTFTTAAARNV